MLSAGIAPIFPHFSTLPFNDTNFVFSSKEIGICILTFILKK